MYCRSENDLCTAYAKFLVDDLVKLYPNFKLRMEVNWQRQNKCALCYRINILTRNNNTVISQEAGIQMVKELVFGRIKAYNLIQIFQSVTKYTFFLR